MPITKSAKKALRVSRRRRVINLRVKHSYKDAVRDVRKTATHVTTEARKNTLSQAYSKLDKAAKKGIVHKNKASRLKSRLAKLTKS